MQHALQGSCFVDVTQRECEFAFDGGDGRETLLFGSVPPYDLTDLGFQLLTETPLRLALNDSNALFQFTDSAE